MNYTWGEIQIIALQKMFLNNVPIVVSDLPTLKLDRNYKNYLSNMPMTANEGLLRIMSVGKPLIKKYTLNKNLPDEIFAYQSYESNTILNEDLVITGTGFTAYYFEIDNPATIKIEEYTTSWEELETITHYPTIEGTYEVIKNIIPTTTNLIRITFVADGYMYNIRRIALYNIKFKYADSVPNNTPKTKYLLTSIIDDFYRIVSVEYENTSGLSKYNSDFIIEGDTTLIIDSKLNGNFIITYEAFPDKIDVDTEDTYIFTTSPEMIALLPLFIASEGYKDDDISLATTYRNQFELGLQDVADYDEPLEFKSNSGWL